ncbi:hypothetical protein [Methyloglobulus sp.]|uniref:hypothetical protein n=1 Tax=Methyloglobulus sp. TaxID=2518622 RepID=UPI0032B75F62
MKSTNVFLSLLGLSAISSFGVYSLVSYFSWLDFPSFPINGLRYDLEQPIASFDCQCPERFPLSPTTRIVLSVIWYALLLSVLALIPLCLARRFKSHSFYQAYKTFWLCGALVLSPITVVLTGVVTSLVGFEGVFGLVIWYITIAYLAILPAYLPNA